MTAQSDAPQVGQPPPERSVMPSQNRATRPLMLVIAAMTFLAAFSFGCLLIISHATSKWTSAMASAYTVQIMPVEDVDINEQAGELVKLLSQRPEVSSAQLLGDQEITDLLEPWLGQANVLEDLPLPQLIDVKLRAGYDPDVEELAQLVEEAVPNARFDAHGQWRGQLMNAAASAQLIAFGILALVLISTIAIVAFATRAGLAANHEVVEVLHHIGARDAFIANEFQWHFFFTALRGGLIGAVAAILTFGTLAVVSSQGLSGAAFGDSEAIVERGLVPQLMLPWPEYAALLLVPAVAGFAALITARRTVLASLAKAL